MQQSHAEYADLARPASAGDPGGEVAQIATELATLNDTIKRRSPAGDTPNDLMDRRDLLLDQLSRSARSRSRRSARPAR